MKVKIQQLYKSKNINIKGTTKILVITTLAIFTLYFFSIPTISTSIFANLKALIGGSKCKNCHVILISLDTLRADNLPCYGYHRNTAPNLCKFASENVTFSHAFTQGASTLDGHTSIFTGLYPSSHHMIVPLKDILHPDITTLPEVLHANDYETIFVAKTDDIHLPLDKGFERGFDSFLPVPLHNFENNYASWYEGVDRLIDNQKKNKPTFLFLHTYAVHAPYLVNDNKNTLTFTEKTYPHIPKTVGEFSSFDNSFLILLLQTLRDRINTASKLDYDESEVVRERLESVYSQLKQASSLEEAHLIYNNNLDLDFFSVLYKRYFDSINNKDQGQIEYLKSLYDENIFNLDQQLGIIFDLLKKKNMLDKTIIVVTSDHGEEFFEHGQFDHSNNIYITSTHVPLIISTPFAENVKIDKNVQTIDIFPTIFELLNIPLPTKVEGKSLIPLINKVPNVKINEHSVTELHGGETTAIRNNNWSYYLNNLPDKENELYYLADDPLEQNNLVDKHPEIERELLSVLEKIREQKIFYPTIDTSFPEWIDPESRENLIKRGYF